MRRDVLERPFPRELIRHRPGRRGESLAYVEGHAVIARLNEAFDSRWSFEIVREIVRDEEVVVLGGLSAEGVTKNAFGSSAITRSSEDGSTVCLGDDLKAAATDALKKAASLLGVALDLYQVQAASTPDRAPARGPVRAAAQAPAREDARSSRRSRPGENGFLSAAQLRAIHAIRQRLEWSERELSDWLAATVNESNPEKLDKPRASRAIDGLQVELRSRQAAPC